MAILATQPGAITLPSPAPADAYLYRIRDLIRRAAGIYHPDNKLYFVADRCGRRMRALGVRSVQDYLERLTIQAGREKELLALLNEITVGETCFFRNMPQAEALRQVVIPAILAARAKLCFTHLRVWSAGCSTGEEPYTLAMVLLEEVQNALRGWTFEVLATDLNERSLEFAKAGVYGDYALRNIPLYYLQKYFRKKNGLYHVNEEAKSKVSFTRLNLVDDSKMLFMKGMDILFCGNVLIYFDNESKRRVIQHFYNNLLPGGYFFLGHSETLFGINGDFQLVHFPGGTAYVKPFRQIAPGGAR